MTDLAVDDQDGGEVADAEIVAGLLLGARQQAPEAVEPTVGPLHHPAPRRMTIGVPWRRQGLRRAGLGWNVGDIAAGRRRLPALGIVIAPVQGQVRWRRRG